MQFRPCTSHNKSNENYCSQEELKGVQATSTETALYTIKYSTHSLIIKFNIDYSTFKNLKK